MDYGVSDTDIDACDGYKIKNCDIGVGIGDGRWNKKAAT